MKEYYKVTIKEEFDDWYPDTPDYQAVYSPDKEMLYEVCDLNECPEDAVIYRDLVSAEDYIEILNEGIKLAKQGYDKVICVYE